MTDPKDASHANTLTDSAAAQTATMPQGSPPLPPRHDAIASTLTQGQRFGPYRILRLLGKGGMGEVYEAEHLETSRRIALKILNQALASPADRERFFREGRLAASISHPHCVYIYGTEEIQGLPVISMELLPGGTLKELIKDQGPMKPAKAVDAILQIVDGLETAADAGVLHRDIKPSNCFLDRDGSVKVGDFGLSISTLARDEMHLTMTGSFLGTPAFAAPEQVRCTELDVRSDIYSVGATLYYLLTGQAPFEGEKLGVLLAAVLEKPPQPLRHVRPEIPNGLEKAVLRCLEKDPARRYPDYASLRSELLPYTSAAPSPATLGLRFAAGLFDTLILAVPWLVLSIRQPGVLENAISTLMSLVYFALLDGLRGATVGKALLGLRVVGPDRGLPGIRRAFLRAAVFTLVPALPVLLPRSGPYNIGYSIKVFFIGFALTICLFASVRRRNSFAGLHDLASGTRVVLRAALQAHRAAQARAETVPAVGSGEKMGPYSVLKSLWESGEERLLLGFDEQLQRRVWLHVRSLGSPPTPPPRRDLARPGRLRWITGNCNTSECWDAFEAPDGEPLASVLTMRHSWATVRPWLADLAEELSAAEGDGTQPALFAADRVWIAGNGRARLLDFPAPLNGVSSETTTAFPSGTPDVGHVQGFLHQLATRAIAGPPPLYVVSLIADLERAVFPSLSAVAGRILELQGKLTAVTWQRRLLLAATVAFIPAWIMVSSPLRYLHEYSWVRSHPDLMFVRLCLKPLLERSRYEIGDVRLNISRGNKPNQIPRTLENLKQQLEVYLAGRYRQELANGSFAEKPGSLLDPNLLRSAAKSVLERHPMCTEEEVAAAESVLTDFLAKARQRATSAAPHEEQILYSHFSVLVIVILVCCISALISRGGFLLRALGMAVVDGNGQEVSRSSGLWRTFMALGVLPAMALTAVYIMVSIIIAVVHLFITPSPALSMLRWWMLFALPLVFYALGILWAVLHPERGLQDRLAGTYLVPR